MPDPRYVDPFKESIEAECSFCGRVVQISAQSCMKVKPGDVLYSDPQNHDFGRCPSCRRKRMVVKTVPTTTETQSVTGFWKLPTDDGDSSGTKKD